MLTPYYDRNGITLYLGDCREVLPQITEQIDLTLTDPPYGNETEYGGYRDSQINLVQLVSFVMPLLREKSHRILLTPGVGNMHLYPFPDWTLCWVTPAGAGSGPWGFCCWQPILAYGKDPYLQNGLGRRPDIFMKTETAEKGYIKHPCSKPIDLWQLVMARGSVKETDVILDPFLGSGTTAVAAKKLGRRCIGIEINEDYLKIAIERLRQDVLL